MKYIAPIVLVLVVFGGLIYFLLGISYRNDEIALRNTFEAKVSDVEASHDKMWKVLQQKAGVTNEYKAAFEKVFPQIIEGRYSGQKDGSLMKFVVEANPTFDTSLYKDLMQSIEAERAAFLTKQEVAIDVQREYNTFIAQQPASFFMGPAVKPVAYKVISSSRSKAAMESGEDNEVDLFPSQQPKS